MPHYKDHDLTSADHPDVDVTSPSDGDVLTWDDASQKWIAGPGIGAGGGGLPGLDANPAMNATGTGNATRAFGFLMGT